MNTTCTLPNTRYIRSCLLSNERPISQARSKTGTKTIAFAKKGDKVAEADGDINTEDISKDCVSLARP